LDILWIMPKIQKPSTNNPLDKKVVVAAIDFIIKAESMGLLEAPVDTLNLNLDIIIDVAKKVVEEGLGRKIVIDPARWYEYESNDLCVKLKSLSDILEHSPVPEKEWPKVREVISEKLLADMLHISDQSLKRYEQGNRQASDQVYAKLHWIALLLGDLLGSYNEMGARNWFLRTRKSFKGKTPFQILSEKDWSPDDENPRKIKDFVKSLNGAMGT
jgi:transcriptional regulator with XRE-family HTH domain